MLTPQRDKDLRSVDTRTEPVNDLNGPRLERRPLPGGMPDGSFEQVTE
jgi:hypothetical protein